MKLEGKAAVVTGGGTGVGRATARSVLKSVCDPEDIATAILGLVASDLITGQVLIVDGGLTIAQ